jgi:ribulose-5-phosphate 4-epimerase/fuculose-1-phosphate aldolase
VVSGATLGAAADIVEELEATAKLWLMLRHERLRPLTADEAAEIARRFPR